MSTCSPPGVLAALRDAAARGVTVADEPTGKALLAGLGIRVPPGRVVADGREAAEAARALGTPVGAKVVATDVAHKALRGGVRGPLVTPHEVAVVADGLVAAHGRRVLVERWLPGALELLVGLTLDGPFGAVVSVGLGGVWAETLGDVAHRLAPVSRAEAAEMLDSLRAAPVLAGGDGSASRRIERVAEVVAPLSALAADAEAVRVISQIEINPLAVGEDGGCVALDCATFLRRPAGGDPAGALAGAAGDSRR